MIKSILVAYDGSEQSREAFAYSIMLAENADADVIGLYAVEPSPPPIAVADPVVGFDPAFIIAAEDQDPEEKKKERERAQKSLDELRSFAVDAGVEYKSVIQDGRLIDVVVDRADPTDLIAIGAKGRFARAGIGSTTKALASRGPCPVLVVAGELRAVNRVLSVYDGSSQSKRAVKWGAELSEQTKWPLTCLAVSSSQLPLDDALEQAQKLAPDAQVVHYGPEDHESETEQIKTAASHATHAVIVMGAYPDSWLHQLFFGGPTSNVLRKVDAPIVLVH